MKIMDPDANQLARTYIDNVEGLLRSNSRLHVNEIDSLLSEINDYVHLRSRELSKGDSVHYREVLEAIDECGSPSEIVKQYLEINSTELEKPFKPIKAKSSPIFSKNRISKFIPLIRSKSPKKDQSEVIITAKSLTSKHSQKAKKGNLRYLTHSYFKKYEQKKKIEKWILISCFTVVGAVFLVPFLAFYWLISLRNAESNFMKSWAENKAFTSVFPYQPEFCIFFTQNRTYQTNLLRINRIKTLFMLSLVIPFYGFLMLLLGFVASLMTLGTIPLLVYYYFKGPNRHINILIEREYQLQSEETNDKKYLAFYNKSGYLSFDFEITTKIMREVKINEKERIVGIFQKESDVMIGLSFLIITTEQIVDYAPPIVYNYEEKLQYTSKNQLTKYSFQRKGKNISLTIESIDGIYFTFRGLNKKVVEPIQNSLNLLGLEQGKPVNEHIKKMKNGVTSTIEPFFCQVCESHQPNATASLICDTCSRAICINCFCQMARLGETNCPKCEGNLIAH